MCHTGVLTPGPVWQAACFIPILHLIWGFPWAKHSAIGFENIASRDLHPGSVWEVLLPSLLQDEKPQRATAWDTYPTGHSPHQQTRNLKRGRG